MASGIRDKVVILGAGCSRFGERWDAGLQQLIVEAFEECVADAGIEQDRIEAAWWGNCFEDSQRGRSAFPLAGTLGLPFIPCTRVENFCCTGTEAFRGAVYAVASGACDIALALGAEKLKDVGYAGLPNPGSYFGLETFLTQPQVSGGASVFSQLANAYAAKYRIPGADLKQALAHVSWKSHQNGALNPKAHLRKAVSMEDIIKAPMIAYPLGLYDCCGVTDGAACAIVTTPEIARSLGKKDLVAVKALQLAVSNGTEARYKGYDYTYTETATRASARAYQEARITDPRTQISMMEVHDCFSVTEMVLMEDLGMSDRGTAWKDIRDGKFDREGRIPCQVDGGLKSFGHPIGASGLRMLYEMYLQLQGRAGARQLADPVFGLTHNLGGTPHENICAITIVGQFGA